MGICYELYNQELKVVLDIGKAYWIGAATDDTPDRYQVTAKSVRGYLASYTPNPEEEGGRYDPRDYAEVIAAWLDLYGPAQVAGDMDDPPWRCVVDGRYVLTPGWRAWSVYGAAESESRWPQ